MNASATPTTLSAPLSGIDAQCHEWAACAFKFAGWADWYAARNFNDLARKMPDEVAMLANRIIALRTQQAQQAHARYCLPSESHGFVVVGPDGSQWARYLYREMAESVAARNNAAAPVAGVKTPQTVVYAAQAVQS